MCGERRRPLGFPGNRVAAGGPGTLLSGEDLAYQAASVGARGVILRLPELVPQMSWFSRLNARSSESLDSAEAKRKEIKIESNWADQVIDVVEDVDTAPSAARCAGSPMRSQPTPVSVPHDSRGRALPAECWRIDELFSRAECLRLLAKAEEYGFGRTNYPPAYRGNLRLITVDPGLARVVFERLAPFAPARLVHDGREWVPVGCNECWRLAKYRAGDRFERHFDAAFVRGADERSMFTVNIYMNSAGDGGDFVGGATRFYAGATHRHGGEEVAAIAPEAGQCVVFRQPPGAYIDHDGEELASGTKYLFRTDIMYRAVADVDDARTDAEIEKILARGRTSSGIE